MKTQISKASHGLAKYSEEFRQQALGSVPLRPKRLARIRRWHRRALIGF